MKKFRWGEFLVDFLFPAFFMGCWSVAMMKLYGYTGLAMVWTTALLGEAFAFSRMKRHLRREAEDAHRMFQRAFSDVASKLEEAQIRSLERAPPFSRRLWGAGPRGH